MYDIVCCSAVACTPYLEPSLEVDGGGAGGAQLRRPEALGDGNSGRSRDAEGGPKHGSPKQSRQCRLVCRQCRPLYFSSHRARTLDSREMRSISAWLCIMGMNTTLRDVAATAKIERRHQRMVDHSWVCKPEPIGNNQAHRNEPQRGAGSGFVPDPPPPCRSPTHTSTHRHHHHPMYFIQPKIVIIFSRLND